MSTAPQISILAGSSAFTKEAGKFTCSLQLQAFERALKYADSIRSQIGRIFLQVDHLGNFTQQFLREDISGEKKRHPRLDYLHPELLYSFQGICDSLGFDSQQIFLIPEQHCRMALNQFYAAKGESRLKHDCESIVAEIFRRLARHGTKVVAFWEENSKRVNPLTISLGKAKAQDMFGVQQDIENIFLIGKTENAFAPQCGGV